MMPRRQSPKVLERRHGREMLRQRQRRRELRWRDEARERRKRFEAAFMASLGVPNVAPPAGCGLVYVAEVASGLRYVGQTRRPLVERVHGHGGDGGLFAAAINKWGFRGVRWRVAGVFPASVLDAAERSLIRSLRTLHPHGYNMRY